MQIIKAKANDKNKWNNFVKKSEYGSFLQSWEWGEFQKSLGHQIWRLIIEDREKILGVALIIKHDLPRGYSYLYCPRGPVLGIQNWDLQIGQKLATEISEIAQAEKAIFLRLEPKSTLSSGLKIPSQFKSAGQVQPKETLILNLEESEKKLLAQMHHKTRYNIRLAKKRGVQVRISNGDNKDIEIFCQLLSETAKRNKIKIFPKEHYLKLLKILGQAGMVKLFIAEYEKKPIAAIIVSFFGPEAVYLHGASQLQFRNLMAPHLLQWETIITAKKAGCRQYDFWGIAPANQPRHKWAGITRFKKGFSGQEQNYLGCLDLVYLPLWYPLYKIASQIKGRV